ncbi:MAG: hypothetical protein ABI135_08750 [Rhodoferax sp.]
MALGWLTALKAIPWTDVISTAPVVVDGAKKLWHSVGKNPAPAALTPVLPSSSAASAPSMAALQARITTLEAEAADLHGQMVSSSELIKALAEQNTQLIRRIETSRVRLLWVAVATAGTAIVAIVAMVLATVR